MQVIVRAGLLVLFALHLAGCDMVTYDLTSDPAMTPFIGRSYVINADSFLLENYCWHEYVTSRCLYMQKVGGSIEVFKGAFGNRSVYLPGSFEDYEKNKDQYDDVFRDSNIFHHTKYSIVAEIPKGTVIKMLRVVSAAEGDSGRDWVVYGQIAGQGSDTSIQIGEGHLMQGGPRWFGSEGRANEGSPPMPYPSFLSPLDSKSH